MGASVDVEAPTGAEVEATSIGELTATSFSGTDEVVAEPSTAFSAMEAVVVVVVVVVVCEFVHTRERPVGYRPPRLCRSFQDVLGNRRVC